MSLPQRKFTSNLQSWLDQLWTKKRHWNVNRVTWSHVASLFEVNLNIEKFSFKIKWASQEIWRRRAVATALVRWSKMNSRINVGGDNGRHFLLPFRSPKFLVGVGDDPDY